jgi:hypothetical protein
MLKTLLDNLESTVFSNEVLTLTKQHDNLKQHIRVKSREIENLESQINESQQKIFDLTELKLTVESQIEKLRNFFNIRQSEIDMELAIYRANKLEEVKTELQRYRDEKSVCLDIELSEKIETLELQFRTKSQALETDLFTLKETLEAEWSAKIANLRERLEAFKGLCSQSIEGLRGEVRAWEDKLEELQKNYNQVKQRMILESKEIIGIEREKFLVTRDKELNMIEHHRLSVEQSLTHDRNKVLEQYKGPIIAPYLDEINSLEAEVIRLNSLLVAKSGKSFNWTIDQIKRFIVKERNGRLEPNHLRIAGESESGKSHLIDQFITEGLQYFGVIANYEILDPFPSQTEWKVSPKISNDSEGVLLRLKYWEEKCNDDSTGLDNPLIIVVDEIDRMILKYKSDVVSALRSIWGGGRHKGIFLWAIGQNANVKKLSPLDWSDLDNCAQIYLNSSANQFIKNGLEGQNTKPLEGELQHLKKQTEYYAVVKVKGSDPYATVRPFNLFPTTEKDSEKSVLKMLCSHCGSEKVSKDGKLNDRQRVKCADCGKKGYLE